MLLIRLRISHVFALVLAFASSCLVRSLRFVLPILCPCCALLCSCFRFVFVLIVCYPLLLPGISLSNLMTLPSGTRWVALCTTIRTRWMRWLVVIPIISCFIYLFVCIIGLITGLRHVMLNVSACCSVPNRAATIATKSCRDRHEFVGVGQLITMISIRSLKNKNAGEWPQTKQIAEINTISIAPCNQL